MIEEIMENRISDNLDSFFESMVSFFGEKHRIVLNDKMKDIEFAVVIDKGYFSVGNTELYVEEEPICVKEGDKSYVLIPATILKEKTGNVSLMHSLLHAISDDYIRNENDLLNEVVTDYMANEISKELKDRDVNVTLEKRGAAVALPLYTPASAALDETFNLFYAN